MTTNPNAPSQFPDRQEAAGIVRGGPEQREVADIRSKLAVLRTAVDSGANERVEAATTNLVNAFVAVQSRLATMLPEAQRELARSIVSLPDAVFIANQINNPTIAAARQGLLSLRAEMDGTNAPGQRGGLNQPAGAPSQSNGLGGFDLNDPLNSLKSMPFVQKIMTTLTQRGIPPNLVESGLSMFVTMALTNYSKNPSIAAALVKMKVRSMRDMASRDPEVARMLTEKRMTLDQAMAQWEATSINNLVEGRGEVTVRSMLQTPAGAPAPAVAAAPATGTGTAAPAAAPSTAAAAAPREVGVNSTLEVRLPNNTVVTLKRVDGGKLVMKSGATERTLSFANTEITKVTVNAQNEVEVTLRGDTKVPKMTVDAMLAAATANNREMAAGNFRMDIATA